MREEKCRVKILCLEDPSKSSDSLATTLGATLGTESYQVISVQSSDEVLRQVRVENFALVLLATRSNPSTFCSILKKEEKLHHTPILLFALDQPSSEEIRKGYEAGAVDYFFQAYPFQLDMLKHKIAIFIDLYQRAAEKESEIKTHHTLLQGVIDGAMEAIFVKDLNGRYTMMNAAGAKFLGKTVAEVVGKTDHEIVPAHQAQVLLAHDQKVLKAGKSLRLEETINVEGVPRVFSSSKSPYRDADGNVKGVIGVAMDISERRRFEEDLILSESRFRNIFEQAPVSIQFFSPQGLCLQVNQAWKALWDMDQPFLDSHIINHYNILEDPQLAQRGVLPFIQKAFAGEPSQIPAILYEPVEAGKKGRSRWTEALIFPIKDLHGVIREVVLIHSDVTDRVQAESTLSLLAESSDLLATSLNYRSSLEQIAQLAVKQFHGWCFVHLKDEWGNLKETAIVNQEAEQYPLSSLTLQIPLPVFQSGKSELICPMTNRVLEEREEDEDQLRGLKALHLKSSLCVPLTLQGSILGTLTLVSSKRYYSPQDLSLAEELASRAALAIQNAKLFEEAQSAIRLRDEFLAIASHELKTPLTPLGLQMQILQKFVERGTLKSLPDDSLKQMFSTSAYQIQSLATLIDNLLDISKITSGKLEMHFEEVNLKRLLNEIAERYSVQLSVARCDLELSVDPTIVGFWDRLRIEEVIVNLLTNAMKYGAGKPIRIQGQLKGSHAEISVQDSGIGISENDQKRIFERFERAVSLYQFGGLGLGLFIVRELVRAHGGLIRVVSQLKQGATFTLDLPLRFEGADSG